MKSNHVNMIADAMLDEIKMWFKEFCDDWDVDNKTMLDRAEEINSLHTWFEEHHKRQGFDGDYMQ